MKETMKKISIRMSLYMGLAMSLTLSLVENISSKRFSFPIFLITLGASFVISVLIGLVIPMGKIGQAATKNMKQGGLGARALESLISDLIYTPVITLAMVWLVQNLVPVFAGMAAKQSVKLQGGSKEAMELAALEANEEAAANLPPFAIMFLTSLALCFVIGYVLIFILQPLFMKLLFKKFRVGAPGAGGPGAPNAAPNGAPQQAMQGAPQQAAQRAPQNASSIPRTEALDMGNVRESGNITDKQ